MTSSAHSRCAQRPRKIVNGIKSSRDRPDLLPRESSRDLSPAASAVGVASNQAWQSDSFRARASKPHGVPRIPPVGKISRQRARSARPIETFGLERRLRPDPLDFGPRSWLHIPTPMRDDFLKPSRNLDTGSWQDWEIEHVVDKICRDFPKKPRSTVESVVKACKEQIQRSAGRERLIDCARRSLS